MIVDELFDGSEQQAGFLLDLYEDRLTITVDPIAYARTQTRYAGPKMHHFVDDEKAGFGQDSNGGLHYSDLIYMMQEMSDTEYTGIYTLAKTERNSYITVA